MVNIKIFFCKLAIISLLFTLSFKFEKLYAWRTWIRNSKNSWFILYVYDATDRLCAKKLIAPQQIESPLDYGVPLFLCENPLQKIDIYQYDENDSKKFIDTITRDELLVNPMFTL